MQFLVSGRKLEELHVLRLFGLKARCWMSVEVNHNCGVIAQVYTPLASNPKFTLTQRYSTSLDSAASVSRCGVAASPAAQCESESDTQNRERDHWSARRASTQPYLRIRRPPLATPHVKLLEIADQP